MEIEQIQSRAGANYVWLRIVLNSIQQMRGTLANQKKSLDFDCASGNLSEETIAYAKQQFSTYEAGFNELADSLEDTANRIQTQMEAAKLLNAALQKLVDLGGGQPGVQRVDSQLAALLEPLAEAVKAAKAQTGG